MIIHLFPQAQIENLKKQSIKHTKPSKKVCLIKLLYIVRK